VVVEGRRLVADLVAWGVPLRELYLAADVLERPWIAELLAGAEHAFQVDGSVLAGIAPTRSPQGILAVIDEPSWPPWRAETGVGLWLDGVQDPGNLGAIIRSAAGLGAEAVLLSTGCADPFSPAAVRGSAGAVLRLPVERHVPAARLMERVREAGGEVWASGSAGTPCAGWSPRRPTLLLIGAEGRGLEPGVREASDGTVTIPLSRGVESLNVAVAAGILLERLRPGRNSSEGTASGKR
jgi:TrmH family RNA methyltransferase